MEAKFQLEEESRGSSSKEEIVGESRLFAAGAMGEVREAASASVLVDSQRKRTMEIDDCD